MKEAAVDMGDSYQGYRRTIRQSHGHIAVMFLCGGDNMLNRVRIFTNEGYVVVVSEAEHCIVTTRTGVLHQIGACARVNIVMAGAGCYRVGPGAALNRVVAGAAIDRVRSGTAADQVIAGAAMDQLRPGGAVMIRRRCRRRHGIVSGPVCRR